MLEMTIAAHNLSMKTEISQNHLKWSTAQNEIDFGLRREPHLGLGRLRSVFLYHNHFPQCAWVSQRCTKGRLAYQHEVRECDVHSLDYERCCNNNHLKMIPLTTCEEKQSGSLVKADV
ncbi:hypothetical protein AMTR_s00130p00120550 [Amborella trichopoda]|uniref:Uncharacterized protein n=1 Tax=Amborella trichopoda TaxID=13333 RepID=W1NRR2_AMBTC|nr:hypothetical protein AMTR_s00130p00120550 [Amborella trichopoda]